MATTLALGIVLGLAMASPSQETVTALVTLVVFFVLLVANPLIGLLIWLVLYPFWGDNIHLEMGAGLPNLSLTRFCVFLLVLMLLAQVATRRRPMFKITKVDAAAFALFLALGASTMVTSDPIRALQNTLDGFFVPLLVYFITRNLIESRQDVDRLLDALLTLGFYSAIYLIYEHLIVGTAVNAATYGYDVRIVRGLLGGPHVFGMVFTMSLPFAVQRYLQARHPLQRVLYLALSGLLLAGIFLTYKRGAWLATVISFLAMQSVHPRFRRFFFALLIVAAIGMLFAGDQFSDSAAANRFNDDLATGNGRTNIWEVAIDLWQERPIFGHGFDQFRYISGHNAVENFYLNMLVSAGLVGFVPLLALILFVAWDSVLVYRRSKKASDPTLFVNWETVAVFGGAAISYLVKGFSGNNVTPLPNILFFLLIGAIIESQVSRWNIAPPATIKDHDQK